VNLPKANLKAEGEPTEGETLTPEEIMQMLQDQLNVGDTNGDGQLSYEESLAILTGLTPDSSTRWTPIVMDN
jgi:hypothetical protein